MGPIAWNDFRRYADEYDVQGEQREDLWYHLQFMDEKYLEWSRKKTKKKAEAGGAHSKGKRPNPR